MSFIPVLAQDITEKIKEVLKKTYPEIEFKVDNSFKLKNELFIPFVPEKERKHENLEIIFYIGEKNLPKLIWFSNDFVYVRLLKKNEKTKTILSVEEIPLQYKERFLKMTIPADLVVPEDLVLSKDLAGLAGKLPITIEDIKEKTIKKERYIFQDLHNLPELKGTLYLTSPDTGKIVHIDLSNPTKINYIDTQGIPWELTYHKLNNLVFVSDIAKDVIYTLKPSENTITKEITLSAMSGPKGIKISPDGSLMYILESFDKFLTILPQDKENIFVKKELQPNCTDIETLNSAKIIVLSCPTTNELILLDMDNFTIKEIITLDGNPEKVIGSDKTKSFYIIDRSKSKIVEIDALTKKMKRVTELSDSPISLALDANQENLYVGHGKTTYISVIDLDSFKEKEKINLSVETEFPSDIEITKNGKYLITTSEATNTISIIDLMNKENVITIDVGVPTHAALILE